ncbi:MAG: hypothetical protein PHS57_06365 [Alphaproteobacteria bacterium]|nr:hypothetical protein [Alphaproteobacteria bacterium]
MDDEIIVNQDEPMPEPTPEQIEEWEREREAAREAQTAPFKALRAQVNTADEYLLDLDFRTSLLELMGGDTL